MRGDHKCTINEESKVKVNKMQALRLISGDNPVSLGSFRSEISVREEQLRHLKINKNAIHPFSKFKAWYDMFLIYLYLSVLITKPVDAGFMKYDLTYTMHVYKAYVIAVDITSWMDIVLKFFMGFELKKKKRIELRSWPIARRYLFGPFFICDVISSIPKSLFYYMTPSRVKQYTLGVVSLLGLFKIVRIVSLMKCIGRTGEYFKIKSRGVLFMIYTLLSSFMIIHWVSCMQFAVPRFIRGYFSWELDYNSWFWVDKGGGALIEKNLLIQYTHGFFKGSAYILGIRIISYSLEMPEEYLLAMFSYYIGKIVMGFIWIILAVTILNMRLMDIMFAEKVNQLEEYMKQKQLPLNLRERILRYFNFKYRGRYFKENLITSLLSDSLRRETSLHACQSLVRNVSLFSALNTAELRKIVEFLIPEIFLANDTIINAGTHGDAMYFISSGTVTVSTRSGKEICHLSDGAYFGEISLVLKGQLRLTTITALETTQVYRLNKKDVERYLLSNKKVMRKILNTAEMRLKQTTKAEEEYKEYLFEQSFRKIS